jgi:hypothetical protein
MEGVKHFLGSVIMEGMREVNLDHWLIRDFLLELLLGYYICEKDKLIYVRKSPSLVLQLAKTDIVRLQTIGKELLFLIGIFPNSLLPAGNRIAGIETYKFLEKIIIQKLASPVYPRHQIWSEVQSHFSKTIKSLNITSKKIYLERPSAYFIGRGNIN